MPPRPPPAARLILSFLASLLTKSPLAFLISIIGLTTSLCLLISTALANPRGQLSTWAKLSLCVAGAGMVCAGLVWCFVFCGDGKIDKSRGDERKEGGTVWKRYTDRAVERGRAREMERRKRRTKAPG
ncbi:hypothetical protein P153DRAFT_435804 [Dothidotthia symphoricarpi CBS 119687]|uniref:Uncharacterized protein n=1 Tax=Dothidotthia symphoricarpi CBS 119687 TaxID=1392245 RepID=A0A6A5ZXK2_9PLEO|nr:uncharacterized protein P153DRAFT_435804 [Dothidotthia symphoricarpi CBS 119687]KAF2123633.1 hypothetical protein P153DRAFT_435804 [Dothidotthia symphoricarpi CBS 119687]